MKDQWYADNRDLVKWSILIQLAKQNSINHILQVAYYRKSEFGNVTIDDLDLEIPEEVKNHFRNINNIKAVSDSITIDVFDKELTENRDAYLDQVILAIKEYDRKPTIIFLDPDTGLEPNRPNLNHVLNDEAKKIWRTLKSGDMIALYQHQTNKNGQPWIEPKHEQFALALKEPVQNVKVAHGKSIARDVVFFYAKKSLNSL